MTHGHVRVRALGRWCFVLAGALFTEAAVAGQATTIPEQPLLGSALTADMLRQLPASGNPFAVLDAMQTESIADRFVAGGLNSATPPRVGGFLNSWTQTQIRFGDITITDPRTGGTPLLVPLLPVFSRVDVAVGALGLDESASAVSMHLEPMRAGTTWVRSVRRIPVGRLPDARRNPGDSGRRSRRAPGRWQLRNQRTGVAAGRSRRSRLVEKRVACRQHLGRCGRRPCRQRLRACHVRGHAGRCRPRDRVAATSVHH